MSMETHFMIIILASELQVWNVEGKAIYTLTSYDYKSPELGVRCIRWDPLNRFIFW